MEDVMYLTHHAQELSFLFVLDSSRRDVSVYPEPNNYEIQFNAPFKNVVGLDLVNATVPRTAYLVEAGANSLTFTSQGSKRTVSIPPGDYAILQLTEALTAALSQVQPALRVEPTSQPAELANTLRIVSTDPFVIHAPASTLRRTMGLGHGDLHSSMVEGSLGAQAALVGPLPEGISTEAVPAVRQLFVAPASGKPTVARVYVSEVEGGAQGGVVQVAIVGPSGQLVAEGQADTTNTQLDLVTVPLGALQHMTAGQQYRAVVKARQVMCDGPAVSVGSGNTGAAWWDYASWSAGTDRLCVDVDMAVDGHAVACPGVVNLTGQPYILVKCPEIEQLLYRDRAFENVHAGMGMVELGNYGIREQRFDFVSFPSRRLSIPIGKLPKLTIRLEKGDGTLYDTKGVDHHLVMLIRYLALTKGPAPGPSTQNPRYTPSALEYLQRN